VPAPDVLPQVFGVGQCSLDYVGRIERFPLPDTKCEFQNLTIQGGGPVATALVALSRWGVPCAFAGVVGDDPFGDTIRQSLETEGVDLSGLMTRTPAASQFAFIAAERQDGRRTIFWQRPTGAPLQPEEVQIPLLKQCQALHTDGLFPEATLAACREARRAGIPVFVDAGSWREGMPEIARCSDYFIASEACGMAISEGGAPLEACRKILEFGAQVAAVTLGSRGYVALTSGGQCIEKPAYTVDAVDTTGCGDMFHAGFLYGILKGLSVEESLDLAAWSAAQVSLKLGGRAGIPSADALRERFLRHAAS
jgi:sulfofructose kinase